MLAGLTYGIAVILLGIVVPGAILLSVMTSLIALLLAPTLATVMDRARWWSAASLALAGALCLVIGSIVVHPSAAHPLRTALVYAENADSSDAWLGTPGRPMDAWTRSVVGNDSSAHGPPWTTTLFGYAIPFTARKVQRTALGAPDVTLIADSTMDGARRVVLRVNAPRGTTGLLMRAHGSKVLAASIDGRVVDTTRYRSAGRPADHTSDWVMQYWAVPDSGAIIALSIPRGEHIDFDLAARRDGLPLIPGVTIPPRPADVVPSQTGDVSIVYRERRF